jgi:hypothetical protein
LAAVDAPLPVKACKSVMVTLPLVVVVKFGDAIVNGPMVPVAELSVKEVVPVIVPPPVIVSVPVAANVSTVPDTLAPMTIPLFTPVSIKLRVPVAVIVLVILIAVAALAPSVKL